MALEIALKNNVEKYRRFVGVYMYRNWLIRLSGQKYIKIFKIYIYIL